MILEEIQKFIHMLEYLFHKPEEEGATRRLYVNCNAGRVLRPL